MRNQVIGLLMVSVTAMLVFAFEALAQQAVPLQPVLIVPTPPSGSSTASRASADPLPPGEYLFNIEPMTAARHQRFIQARQTELEANPPQRVAPLPEQRIVPRIATTAGDQN